MTKLGSLSKCDYCEATMQHGWFLNDFNGVTGYFCCDCYQVINHNDSMVSIQTFKENIQ